MCDVYVHLNLPVTEIECEDLNTDDPLQEILQTVATWIGKRQGLEVPRAAFVRHVPSSTIIKYGVRCVRRVDGYKHILIHFHTTDHQECRWVCIRVEMDSL
ncbi:hypothetical protein FA13DRAFT_1708283 [Coprinellus micaceus]|uniref:Uncharacterized protein n=1 Tax=Coprinellus micaceus TaxID=71717 RepID=A0A4Y7TH42_COPMI|nr:hypothetical protein FA13DRAFT_1708283 [Coprinellus micaceus]